MTTYATKFQQVIDEGVPEDDRTIVALAANRMMNMTGGRPSDAARSEVRHYQRLGAAEYRRQWEAERESERTR
jgi:hypothetical protein